MSRLLTLASELVRLLVGNLQGEELPLALTNMRVLRIARSLHDDRMLSEQRLSMYLSSESLTMFVLNHGMVVVNEELMNLTAQHGNVLSVQILREQEPPCLWDQTTCRCAAENGHLHVLQWLRSQDPPCPWDEDTCRGAAEGGHLHVLQWLRSQDPLCPWDEETCRNASQGSHLHVLQ